MQVVAVADALLGMVNINLLLLTLTELWGQHCSHDMFMVNV
jgi:hypothetical protein